VELKAATFQYCCAVWCAGIGLMPVASGVWEPPIFIVSPSVPTLHGVPWANVMMFASCQPPTTSLIAPLLVEKLLARAERQLIHKGGDESLRYVIGRQPPDSAQSYRCWLGYFYRQPGRPPYAEEPGSGHSAKSHSAQPRNWEPPQSSGRDICHDTDLSVRSAGPMFTVSFGFTFQTCSTKPANTLLRSMAFPKPADCW